MKRKWEEGFIISTNKSTKFSSAAPTPIRTCSIVKYPEEKVVVLLDQHIKSEQLKFKWIGDSLILDLLSDEFKFAVEYMGQEIIADAQLLKILQKRWGKKLWGYRQPPATYFNSREFVLEHVEKDPVAFSRLPSNFRDDKEVALLCIKKLPHLFQFCSDRLRRDREFILEVVSNDSFIIPYLDYNLRNNREIILKYIQSAKNSANIDNVMVYGFQNDKELLLATLELALRGENRYYSNEPVVYSSIPNSLKYDPDICKILLRKKRVFNLEEIPEKIMQQLQRDEEFILYVLSENCLFLPLVCDELKNNINFIEKALKKNCGGTLLYFEEQVIKNKDLCLTLLENMPDLGSHLPDSFRKDRDFMLKCVKVNGFLLKFASYALKCDREMVLESVKTNGQSLKYASDDLLDDREIVMIAVKENGRSIQYASERLKGDREMAILALNQDPESATYLPKSLRNDKQIILYLIERCENFPDIPLELKSDPEVLAMTYICISKFDRKYEQYSHLANDKELMRRILRDYRKYIDSEVTIIHEDVVLEGVKIDPYYARLLPKPSQSFVEKAALINFKTLSHLHSRSQSTIPYKLENLFEECLTNRLQSKNLSQYYKYVIGSINLETHYLRIRNLIGNLINQQITLFGDDFNDEGDELAEFNEWLELN